MEQNDVLKFKKHIWYVIKNLNTEVQQPKYSFPEKKDPPQDQYSDHILYYKLNCCLEERVRTLEKELDSKQKIIEPILKQQNSRCHTQQVESTNRLEIRQSISIKGKFNPPERKRTIKQSQRKRR